MMKYFILPLLVFAVIFPTKAFGCSISPGLEVLLPWHARLDATCNVTGYELSLAGIVYTIIGGIALTVFVILRTRKITDKI